FNLYEALKKCEDKLIQFGGHCHAAGLEINIEKIDEFRESFNALATEELTRNELQPEIEIDSELQFDEINNVFINILSFFEPYGPGNSIPIFITENVQIVGAVKNAKSDTHIFKVKDAESKRIFEAVFFLSKDYKEEIKTGNNIDICYSVDRSLWNGKETIKLRVKDLKLSKP
ncbi:MAG: single-stranded-DNA-specific exonuclease RecJ, partial [Ignavibacteriae bacterium]|nr:single-stranded-DNA-specific exonuclease RecJ [Ignavibacteriota bacterium]